MFVIAVAGVIISGLVGCANDRKSNTLNVFGTWRKSATGGIKQYQFRRDSIFVFIDMVIDEGTTKVQGYRYQSKGRYHINNSELIFYAVKLLVILKEIIVQKKNLLKL